MRARASRKSHPLPKIPLTPEAERALAEAEERRKKADEAIKAKRQPNEVGGTGGPGPTCYSDWENKGITSDF